MEVVIRFLRWLLRRRAHKALPPPMSDLGAVAVAVARQEIGRGESGKNNQGEDIERYRRGRGPRGAWCAAFCAWVLEESSRRLGGAFVFVRSHGARRLFKNLLKAGAKKVPRPLPGDIVLWSRGAKNSWRGHIGIVVRVSPDGTYWAIEGNRGTYPARVDEFKHQVGEGRELGFCRLPRAHPRVGLLQEG